MKGKGANRAISHKCCMKKEVMVFIPQSFTITESASKLLHTRNTSHLLVLQLLKGC